MRSRRRSRHAASRHSTRQGVAIPRSALVSGGVWSNSQTFDQCPCLFEVGRLGSLGEPIVDRRQELICGMASALIAPERGKASRGTQLPGHRALLACPVDRLLKLLLGCFRRACCMTSQQHLTLDPNQFGDAPAILTNFASLDRLLDQHHAFFDLSGASENQGKLALEDHVRQRGSCFVDLLERASQQWQSPLHFAALDEQYSS